MSDKRRLPSDTFIGEPRVTPLTLPISLALLLSFAPASRELAGELRACDLAERRAAMFKRAAIDEGAGVVTTVLPPLFGATGFILAPGPLTSRGPVGVTRLLERDTLNPTSRLRTVTIGGDVSRDGSDGYTYGYFDTFRANGDSLLGWYHAYWRRDADGAWKILAMTRRRRAPGAMSPARMPLADRDTRCIEPARTFDSASVVKQMMAADLAFSDSAATSVAAAFGAYAADDAAKAGGGSVYVYGKQAIMTLFDPPPPAGLKWQPEIGTAARSGDFGFTVGSAGPRAVDPNAPPRDPATIGHYFTIWHREANGHWRYIID
jgi:hypothetical protein